MDRMIPQMMAKTAGATEELKARDQMVWVGLMNNCKARVEEVICGRDDLHIRHGTSPSISICWGLFCMKSSSLQIWGIL